MDYIRKELKQLEKEWDLEASKLRDIYFTKMSIIRKQCKHFHDDGNSALVRAGKPFHSGWDECEICGTFVETSEYSRD